MVRVVTCIPAYNEERTIARVVIDSKRYSDVVIVCDDGSSDYTGAIAEGLGAVVVRHERNLGYGAALRTLFEKALEYGPDVIVTIDADLQHDPRYIPVLVKAVADGGADIAIASRGGRSDETPVVRRAAIRLLSKVMGIGVKDVQSGFRAYRASVVRGLMPSERGMEASVEILRRAAEMGLRIVEVEVPFRYAGVRRPSENPLARGYSVLTRILRDRVMEKPLTYLGGPGLAMLLLGLASGSWVVWRYIETRMLAVGTALITVMLVIGGLLLTLMGILLFAIKEYARLRHERGA